MAGARSGADRVIGVPRPRRPVANAGRCLTRLPRGARHVAGILMLVLGALLGGLAQVSSAQEVIDRILAVAAGEVITLSDVRTARELGRVEVGSATDPVREALTRLIDRALILEEAERFAPPEPTPAAIEAAMVALVQRAGSARALDAQLARLGVDVGYVRGLVREDLRIRAYLDQRFTADSPEQQRRLVEEWVAGLRQRAEIVNLYDELSAPGTGTGAPARD